VSPPDRMSPPPEGGWESLKVDELKAELEARGLPKSGTKAELVERLVDDDAAQGEAAPAAEAPAAEAAEAPAPEAAADEAPAAEAPDEGVAEEVAVSEAAGQPAAEEVFPPEEPAEEPSADEVEEAEGPEGEEAEGEAAPAPATRRRGAAEISTGERRAAPRLPDGEVVVRARSKYVRSAPRKARLVMDHIRGKEVEQARAILTHAPRAVADDILKLLNSAIANAETK
jgi:hypothetical protein